jgi:hypothetical protein
VWKSGRRQTLTTFSRVDLSLRKSDKPFEFLTIIEEPGDKANITLTID